MKRRRTPTQDPSTYRALGVLATVQVRAAGAAELAVTHVALRAGARVGTFVDVVASRPGPAVVDTELAGARAPRRCGETADAVGAPGVEVDVAAVVVVEAAWLPVVP